MLADDPWNFTQMMEARAYTQPFDRHYIGGGRAFEYLAERGDTTSVDFFQTAMAWHNRIPFLGHGVWLGMTTEQFPHELTDEIQTELQDEYEQVLDRRRPFTPVSVVSGEAGLNHRRPYWLDDSTLVAYVHGYDTRPGFYRISVTTGQRDPIRVQSLTEDRMYSVGRDTTALYASRYVQDPLVGGQEIAEVERVSLNSGEATRLTEGGRVLAPAEGPNGTLHAVRNDGPFTRWVELQDGDPSPLTSEAPTTVRQVAPSSSGEQIALLINAEGDQRIYRAQRPMTAPPQIDPWIGLEGAIIYDLSWGPRGRYLLFAADHPDTANIFAFDTHTKEVLQLTSVPFGALEPTLSPDRSTVAFVNYQHERHDLVQMPFRPDSATVVSDAVVQFGGPSPRRTVSTSASLAVEDTTARSYSSWRHLSPRMLYPVVRGGEEDLDAVVNSRAPLGLGVGIGVAGTDPLQRWAYRARTYWQDGRLWGEARVQSGRFLLRPSLSVFNRGYNVDSPSGVGFEERGTSVGVRLPVTLSSNVYQSFFQIGLDSELRQTRFFGRDPDLPTPYTTRLTLSPTAQLGYRLQQNPRDIVPNTGIALGVEGEFDAWHNAGPNRSQARYALRSELQGYVPGLRSSHTGIRLGLGFLSQNQPALLSSSMYLPRGFEDASLAAGTFLRLDGVVTQPLWYVDDGLFLLPLYVKALSVYGFGQRLGRLTSNAWREAATSVGAGLSLETRFFYILDLELRVGAAYRWGPRDVRLVFR